jgi:hypothetical protein
VREMLSHRFAFCFAKKPFTKIQLHKIYRSRNCILYPTKRFGYLTKKLFVLFVKDFTRKKFGGFISTFLQAKSLTKKSKTKHVTWYRSNSLLNFHNPCLCFQSYIIPKACA